VRHDQSVAGVDGVCIITTDEANKARESCNDALGRTTAVIEDPNTSADPDVSSGLNIETEYTYTTDTTHNNNQVVTITQKGRPGTNPSQYRIRTAAYDSLGRLLSATNPETGTITYSYDDNGNMLTRTDARNIIATYAYDALNRPLQVSYSDGTVGAIYRYDYLSFGAINSTNPVGKLTATAGTDRRNWQGYSYDVMGRPQAYFQCTGDANGLPTGCGVSTAQYNLAGDLIALAAPDGFTINYTYDQAGQILTAKDSNGFTYANNITYAANGSVTAIPTPNFTYNYAYNNRFQPTQC
jgi:YD repeat-containing protein